MDLSESQGRARNNCNVSKIESKISKTCMADTLKYVNKISLPASPRPHVEPKYACLRSSQPLLLTFINPKAKRSINSHILSR